MQHHTIEYAIAVIEACYPSSDIVKSVGVSPEDDQAIIVTCDNRKICDELITDLNSLSLGYRLVVQTESARAANPCA